MLPSFLMAQAIFEPTFSCINTLTIPKPSYSSYLPAYEDGTDSVPKRRHIKSRRRGITHEKANNMSYVLRAAHKFAFRPVINETQQMAYSGRVMQ
jgi:hypothetical protein